MNKEIMFKTVYWATNLSISLILYFSFMYFYTLSSNPFEYHSITSTQEVYNIWDDISFISHITRNKPLYMEYNDILRCQFDWLDYTWFSSTKTYSKLLNKTWTFTAEWRYDWTLPTLPARCYLDSQPTALLDFGIRKTQQLRSNYFIIEDTK